MRIRTVAALILLPLKIWARALAFWLCLQPHTLALCLGTLLLLTVVNLRGIREAGGVFMLPTYVFIFCLLALIAVGAGAEGTAPA